MATDATALLLQNFHHNFPILIFLLSYLNNRHLRILLVEDNIINQKVAEKMLKRLGYNADVAINGIEALQAIEHQSYDVILMDVMTPGMNGLEATKTIRKHCPPARQPYIIAVTACVLENSKEICIRAGMNDYISKPLKIEDLQVAIDAYKRDL